MASGKIEVKIVGDASSLSRAFSQSSKAASGFGRSLGSLAKISAVAFAAYKTGDFLKGALNAFADFEQTLNTFKAVSHATATQMEKVSDLSKALGRDVTLPATSAKDAAEAMTELAKGGLDVKQSMAAAKGVLQLSAAAQISNAEAATITARALNSFGLSGNQAIHVADVLANSANVSTGEVTDMANALQQSSAVAKQAGLSIEDTAAAISIMANKGIVGSDAGTSLKQMLLSLNPQTTKAADAFRELGVQAYDSAGRHKDFTNVVGQFHDALAKLTPVERDHALQTIFGSDATRAANIIFGESVQSFDAMKEAVGRSGGAAELAGAKMQGLKGQMEALHSNVETLAIELGEKLAPAANTALTWVNKFLGEFSSAPTAAAKFKVATTAIRDGAILAGEELVKAFKAINWNAVGDDLVKMWKFEFNTLLNAVRSVDWRGLGKTAGDLLVSGLKSLTAAVSRVDWGQVGTSLAHGIENSVKAIGQFLAGVDWSALLGAILRGELAVIKSYYSVLAAAGKELGAKIIQGIWTGLKGMWVIVSGWFNALPGLITSYFSGAGGWLVNAGVAVLTGFIHGIESKIGALKGTLTGIAGKVVSWKGPPAKDAVMLYPAGQLVMQGFIRGIQSQSDNLRTTLQAQTRVVTGEVNRLQKELDAIQKRREDKDNRQALVDAISALAAARKKGEGVLQAERDLDRAREAIRVTALSRELAAKQAELAANQAHFDKVKAQADKANEAMLKARQKALDLMQKQLDKARDRAATSMNKLSDLIQRGFDAANDAWVSPAQQAINAIQDRRTNEDLKEAVRDAQDRLKEALLGDDPEAISDAQRALARAQEDIQLNSLEKQAQQQQTAHDQAMQALQDQFDQQIALTGGNMDKILAVIKKYDGGFAEAGKNLGQAFARELRAAMNQAVQDAAAVKVMNPATAGAASAARAVAFGGFPSFDTGGFVARSGLAYVHKGEMVSRGGGGVTVNLPNYLGDKNEVAQIIVDTINSQQRIGRAAFAN